METINQFTQAQQEGAPAQQASKEEELLRREEQVRRRELRAKALEALADAQMPTELAQLLDYSSEEAFAAALETLKAVWSRAVQKGVETRVAGSAPRAGDVQQGASLREAIARHYNQ